MENTKTDYQYLHDDGNWYPIEIRKCNMTRACGTINQGRPYQPIYIKGGREHPIRYRKPTVESAIAELQTVVEDGDGTCNGKRYRLTPGEIEDAATDTEGQLRLFVYGTLKRGGWNHQRFCGDAISIEKATVRGRLYGLPSGIPALEVPDQSILAVGTANPEADVRTQLGIDLPDRLCDLPGWCHIEGEMITFSDTLFALPPIDRLEGFKPNGHSMYVRVLLVVLTARGDIEAAWCYVAPDHTLRESIPLDRDCWS